MSLEDRINKVRQDAQRKVAEEEAVGSFSKKEQENAHIQAWTQTRAEFRQNRDIIKSHVVAANLFDLLQRARKLTEPSELYIKFYVPRKTSSEGHTESEWEETLDFHIRTPYLTFEPLEMSKLNQDFTLMWNQVYDTTYTWISVRVNIKGDITFNGNQTLTIHRKQWEKDHLLIEQQLGDVILAPHVVHISHRQPLIRN